jgi:hypothetical protein
MSAVIVDFATYRSKDSRTIAERVAARLPGVAFCIVRYAQVFAESYKRKTGCPDSDAVAAGVRSAQSRPDPEPPRAA